MWASALSCCVSPIHFWPLSSRWTDVGLNTVQLCSPHSLSTANYSLVSSFSPHAHFEPKVPAGGDEEVSLQGELLRAQQAAVVSSQIPASRPSCHLSVHIRVITLSSPCMLCTEAVWKNSLQGCRAACLLGTHRLQLLTVYWAAAF
jgi:hypothetical protein